MFDVQMRLADMLTRSSEAVTKAKAMLAQPKITAAMKQELTNLLTGPKEPEAKAAAQQPAKTTEVAPQKQPPPPAEKPLTLTDVQSAISTLYGIVDRADATPTPAQVESVNATAAKFEIVMKRFEAVQIAPR